MKLNYVIYGGDSNQKRSHGNIISWHAADNLMNQTSRAMPGSTKNSGKILSLLN